MKESIINFLKLDSNLFIYRDQNKDNNYSHSNLEDFKYQDYLTLNPNLNNLSPEKSSQHYIQHGRFEGRILQKNESSNDNNIMFDIQNDIDYLRYHGIQVNTSCIRIDKFLKQNHNLFDYIFILHERYIKKYLKYIFKICHSSNIVDLIPHLDNLKEITCTSKIPEPLVYIPEFKGEICILYQCYYSINNCQKVLQYFKSLNDSYRYTLIIINNNSNLSFKNFKNEQQIGYIIYLNGDNSYLEMSGYQTGIDYLKAYNLVPKFGAFILINETAFTNFPLFAINRLDYTHLDKIMSHPIVLGKIDNHNQNKVFSLENFKIKNWIRSNLILFNKEIFASILDYSLVNYTLEKCFHNENLIINMSPKLKRKISKWLSKDRYSHLSKEKYKLKVISILNEYRLSQHLLTFCDLSSL